MSTGDDHRDDTPAPTRTRLPESDGAPLGGPRRGPSRGMITAVAVVVLLVAALAYANRGGTTDSDPDAKSPTPAPTTATGDRPVSTKTSGIPTGYGHDRNGAQSAAANYAVVLGSADMFDRNLRQRIVDTVYTPATATDRRDDLDKVYTDKKFLSGIGLDNDGSAPDGMTFISRIIPVGTKVKTYSATSATVAIWYTSLFGLSGEGSKNPVSESWFTSTYELRWIDGDWKVDDFQQKDGPVPVGRDQVASNAEDMTKAVEQFGGFTYAR
ncbi:hypothetical protein [Streptomyces sp. NPDC058045]|uniref:hypothetical protein n=1 Tax=Streptomyces sp. NPDC058045 TaxID=3346311 RepID=UPI0036F181C0